MVERRGTEAAQPSGLRLVGLKAYLVVEDSEKVVGGVRGGGRKEVWKRQIKFMISSVCDASGVKSDS